jgi:hypothetical protein
MEMKMAPPLQRIPQNPPLATAGLVLILTGAVATSAEAAAIVDNSGGSAPIISSDGLVKDTLKPITALSSGSFNTGLGSGYPPFVLTNGTSAPGTFTVSNYQPMIYTTAGHTTDAGAVIGAQYANPSAPPTGQQFQFIQVASTTGFGSAFATPHIDPLTPDDALPFYWTTSESAGHTNSTGSVITFADAPQAPFAGLKNGPVSFTGQLYVSQTNGTNAATVQDGFSWGYDMTLATDGKATGTFSQPSPTCPPATCTGVGTSSFSWGIGSGTPPSSLQFVGSNFTPVIDTPFQIGTLNYFNGTIQSGSGVDSVNMDAMVSFGFGSSFGTPFDLPASLTLINTPNLGVDPFADADYVLFNSGGFTGSFHVFEGDSASVPIMAELTTGAIVIGEKQPNILGSVSSPFELEIIGFGDVSGGGFVTGVPEPNSISIFLVAIAALLAGRKAPRWLNRNCGEGTT